MEESRAISDRIEQQNKTTKAINSGGGTESIHDLGWRGERAAYASKVCRRLACMWYQEFKDWDSAYWRAAGAQAIHSGARDGKSKVDNRLGQPEISIDGRKSVFISQNQGIRTERLGSGPDYTTL